MRYLLVVLLLSLSPTVWAASMDADGDGTSDPTIVEAENSLDWKAHVSNTETTLADDFGSLGDHLMPGHYAGAAKTNLAFVENDGSWTIRTTERDETINFGADGASYIGGGDFDGDGKDDIAYRTQACKRKAGTFRVMTDALGSQSTSSFRAGQGKFFSTYGDVSGDGKDEFCYLKPRRKGRTLRPTFIMVCKDALTGTKIKQFSVGKVHNMPVPVKQIGGSPDLFAFIRNSSTRTIVIIRNVTGSRLEKIKFNSTGTLLVGHFTNDDDDEEQIGLYANSELTVWDLSSHSATTISAPNGIGVDEINNNDFEDNDDCYCTSKTIKQNDGKCRGSSGGGDNGPGVISGSCDQSRSVNDGGYNFLHKPVSESTGAIVNLFPRSDDPSACWYENQNNVLIGNAYFTGYSNPDRPTFRPTTGGSCGSFPSNFIIACNVRGSKHCWQIPNPCSRYD